MFKKVAMWILVAGILAGTAGVAKADDVAELRKQMEKQYEQMRQMQSKLIELEAAQKQQGSAVQKLEKTGGMEMPEALAWLEKVKLYGDFRYRYEMRNRTWSSDDRSDRHRIRARLGLKADINDEMMFDVRLVSGSEDPVSTNETLGDGFTTDRIMLDRAYLKWTPATMDGWAFLFGKMGNPFFKPGKAQLIWDGDLSPEGIAAHYSTNLSDTTGLFLIGGATWALEKNSDDLNMYGVQAGLKHALDDGSNLTWGAGYFCYDATEGEGPLYDGEFFGNSNDGTDFDHNYRLVEVFGEYTTKMGDLPVSFYGDYVVNTANDVEADTGWLLGTKLGKAKPGQWEFGYNYRDLEADAVVGAFTDSDFANGGTDGKGHKFSAGYGLSKNAKLGLTYFCNDATDESPEENYERLQIDLKVKF